MLVTNMRNDKLAAARVDFLSCGMLDGTCLGEVLRTLQDATGEDATSDSDADGVPDVGNNGNEDTSCGPVDGLPILGEVTLCSKKGVSIILIPPESHRHNCKLQSIPRRSRN